MALRIVLLVAIALGAGIHALSYAYVSSDDAFISLRYARNLAEGHGLRYNPGEPPVEGLSNPLFSICNGVLIWLGAPPVWVIKGVGWVSYLAAVILLPRLVAGDDASIRPAWRYLAPAMLAASAFPALWAVAGLETGFHAFLILSGTILAVAECRRQAVRFSPMLFCLVAANRPEGVLLGVAVFVAQLGLIDNRRRAALMWLVGMVLPCAVLLGLRHMYYGAWLPNTYLAKVTFGSSASGRGFQYLLDFFLNGGYWTVVPAVAVVVGVVWRRQRRPDVAIPLAAVTCQFAFAVLVGGDFMPGYRFVMPVYPLLCAMAASAFVGLIPRIPAVPGWATALCMAAVLSVGGVLSQSSGLRHHGRRSWLKKSRSWISYVGQTDVADTWLDGHQKVAEYLRTEASPDDLLAVTEAGVIPFFSRLPVLDMLGLNSRTVAQLWRGRPGENIPAAIATPALLQRAWAERNQTIADHVLSQRPRWIVIDGSFDAVTGQFVPRLDLGRALVRSPGWRDYRQVFTAMTYPASLSDTGVERIDVVFKRKGG